jgi:hypothetical protein
MPSTRRAALAVVVALAVVAIVEILLWRAGLLGASIALRSASVVTDLHR